MMIGAMFFGLILVLCLAYFIFIKAWKQEVVAFKIIGFVLVGLLILTVLCAPVCMMMHGKKGMGMDCCDGNGNFNKKMLIRGAGAGGPNMMWFNGNATPGGCPMMNDEKVDVVITTDDKALPAKPGEKITTTFEMPIWERAVDMMKGNDANIKTFVDKVKANPDLLKKLKDALAK